MDVGRKKFQGDKSREPNFADLSFSLYLRMRTYRISVTLCYTLKHTRNAYSWILTHVLGSPKEDEYAAILTNVEYVTF